MTGPQPAHPLVSIIVPVFNEAATVASVIARLLAIELPAPREIIVVNDGSSDGTRAVLDDLSVSPLVTVVHGERNRGKGHAIRLGLARARGTVIAIQDADLELDPAQLASLVSPILDGTSAVVYGSRFLEGRPQAPWVTIVANRTLTAVTNAIYGASLTDMETCYKIMRSDVARSLELTADRFDIEPEITARLLVAGHAIDERPVTFNPRSRAAGKKIGWRDGIVALRVLLRLRPRGALLTRALLLLAALTTLVGVAVLLGGFAFRIGGTLVRGHDPIVAGGAVTIAIWLAARRGRAQLADASRWWWLVLERGAAAFACAIAIAAMAVAWAWGARVAGGSDSYCYLSQAELLASGHARERQPIAESPPWPMARWSFVPVGYAPGPERDGAIVPICPAGYPLMMVAARAIAGRPGMFTIVPLLGGLAVWLTFVFGRQLAGPRTGLTAALLLAASPVFIYQIVQPMNDVPAAALWLAALTLGWRATVRPGLLLIALGGAATGAALMVRPNLLPLAAVVGFWVATSADRTIRGRVKSLVAFAAGTVPFVLIIMAVQNAMYGSPLRSGYGDLGFLFRREHVLPNLIRYPRWLLETQTLLVLLAPGAPFFAPTPQARRAAWWLLAFIAATFACYLPYVVFDAWWYLRFVLPALGPILVLTSMVAVSLVARLPLAWRAPGFALLCGIVTVATVHAAVRRQAFDIQALESRYRDAGEYVASHLPANAAVVTVRESGSVRFYAGFPTLVWSEVEPESLDGALDYLRSRGLHPYLLFETGEEPSFRKRFEGKSAIGELQWPAIADIDREVRVYDPADNARYRQGATILTERVVTRRR